MTRTSTTPLVFIDTETTGLDPERRLAWDVAMIRRDQDGETEHQFYVETGLGAADPFALNMGGFWERHPQGRYLSGKTFVQQRPTETAAYRVPEIERTGQLLTERAALERIMRITHGAHLVGAIPSFDALTIDARMRANDLQGTWHYHLIDVEAMCIGWLAALDGDFDLTPPWKSDALAQRMMEVLPQVTDGEDAPDLHVSGKDRHTALGDARWAMRWYDAITARPGAKVAA